MCVYGGTQRLGAQGGCALWEEWLRRDACTHVRHSCTAQRCPGFYGALLLLRAPGALAPTRAAPAGVGHPHRGASRAPPAGVPPPSTPRSALAEAAWALLAEVIAPGAGPDLRFLLSFIYMCFAIDRVYSIPY